MIETEGHLLKENILILTQMFGFLGYDTAGCQLQALDVRRDQYCSAQQPDISGIGGLQGLLWMRMRLMCAKREFAE